MDYESSKNTVEDTAKEAMKFKSNTVRSGYYNDPFIKFFCKDFGHFEPHQRFGTFIRVFSIMDGLKEFHKLYGSNSVVIVLGCGYDTLFWRATLEKMIFSKWIEVDKCEVIENKKRIIQDSGLSGEISFISYDFNNNTDLSEKIGIITDLSMPRLYIDEFSMVYVKDESIIRLLKDISLRNNDCFISYSMVCDNDSFADFVFSGFKDLGIPLLSKTLTQTNEQTECTFHEIGFPNVASTRSTLYARKRIPYQERKRVSCLDYFEDPAEIEYILKHNKIIFAGNQEFVKCFK